MTLREHIEAIRLEADRYPANVHAGSVREHALAALAILDAAHVSFTAAQPFTDGKQYRWILDSPDPAS